MDTPTGWIDVTLTSCATLPLPALILQILWILIIFFVQGEKRIITVSFFSRENILKAASRPNFANIVGLSQYFGQAIREL